jgi:sugar-specific transcriptional regulator TrmB
MSLEQMLDTLVGLGLTRTEAQVYVFLAKKGPHTRKDLTNAMKLTKQQLYQSLENLRAKRMIKATRECQDQFTAVSLEKVLDQFMKATKKQAEALQASRAEILFSWRSMVKEYSANS